MSADGGLTVSDTESQLIGSPFLESIFLAYSNVKKEEKLGQVCSPGWAGSLHRLSHGARQHAERLVSREQGKLIVNLP